MTTYMNAFVTEAYTPNGEDEERTSYVKVGAAFHHKNGDGLNVVLTPGISVSGTLVILPPLDRDEEADTPPAKSGKRRR